MSENRKQILEMLANGRINADEAERLLSALENGPIIDVTPAQNLRFVEISAHPDRARTSTRS